IVIELLPERLRRLGNAEQINGLVAAEVAVRGGFHRRRVAECVQVAAKLASTLGVVRENEHAARFADRERQETRIVETELISRLETELNLIRAGHQIQSGGVDLEWESRAIAGLQGHFFLVNLLADRALQLIDKILPGCLELSAEKNAFVGAEDLAHLATEAARQLDVGYRQVHGAVQADVEEQGMNTAEIAQGPV